MQATTKKAKEEKAQGFGRKLDAEKIIGATNEPGPEMFTKLYPPPHKRAHFLASAYRVECELKNPLK